MTSEIQCKIPETRKLKPKERTLFAPDGGKTAANEKGRNQQLAAGCWMMMMMMLYEAASESKTDD